MSTSAELLDLARRFHQEGDLAQAEPLYRQILQADPAHAPATHYLGLLAFQSGQAQAGEVLMRRSIALNPTARTFHFHLGQFLRMMGKPEEAVECFRSELRLNFAHVESHHHLGMVLVDQGQLAEAISCYLQVLRINPGHAEAQNNLGIARFRQGQYTEAAKCFQAALTLNPNNASTHVNLGNVLMEQGQAAEAAESFRRALQLKPDLAIAHNSLGWALMALKRPEEALASIRQALQLDPNYVNAYNNQGNTLQDLGRIEEAIASYRQALALNPNNVTAHYNLGNAFLAAGRWAEAADSCRQALRLNPNHVETHSNLGIALVRQGFLTEAMASFGQALAIDPRHGKSLWNRSYLRLQQGDLEGGWPDYEYRWSQPGKFLRVFEQPSWDGSSLEGKSILVYSEQGLGDTIQFARYLPLVQKRGGKVIFECQPELKGLMAGIKGVDQVIATGAALPPFTVQRPLLSLPGILGTTLGTIPADVPYLGADPALVAHWRQELKSLPGFKIGIVWQGNPDFPGDRFRSLPLRHFEKLGRLPGIQLVSLQKGQAGISQLSSLAQPFPILDLSTRLETFSDTAAVMMNLDLVISSCTAVPHLAGALGVPVWTVLQFIPDWRWFLDRPDSPWYPTMRLFRQKKLDDWDEVFERIAAEVAPMNEYLDHG